MIRFDTGRRKFTHNFDFHRRGVISLHLLRMPHTKRSYGTHSTCNF